MKKFLTIMTVALAGIFSVAAQQNVVSTSFRVDPQMTCQNCENKIKSNLRFEKGVKDIKTSVADQLVVVTYDADKTNVDLLTEGFKKIGYTASEVTDDAATSPATDKKCCKDGDKKCCKEGKKCEKSGDKKCCKDSKKARAYAPDPENGKPAIKCDPAESAAAKQACIKQCRENSQCAEKAEKAQKCEKAQ